MNREDFNQNFILLNIGYAYHDADWNWKNVKSPFSRIHIVIKGNAKIIRDDRTVYTKENHMYLTPSHINHSYKCDGIYEQYYIHIYEKTDNNFSFFDFIDFPVEVEINNLDIELIKRLVEINPHRGLPHYDPKKYDDSATLAKNISKNKDLILSHELETEAILKILISRFMKDSTFKTKSMDKRVLKSLKYIYQNLHKPISVDNLSEMCFLSNDHFIRLFKKEMNITPIKFINQKKIEQAQLSFLINDALIKDVAFSLGFDNISYFNKMFKKYSGETPMDYKKQFSV